MTIGPEAEPVTDESSLFRREALEHRARARGPGEVVRIAPRWTTTAFYGLIGLFAAAVVAGIVVEIDRYAQGTVTTDREGRVVVLLPAALVPDVAPGRPVELGDAKARVVSSGETVLYPADVRRRYGVDVASPSVAVVTSAEKVEGNGGAARVLLEREPVIVALIPGLDELFGDEDV